METRKHTNTKKGNNAIKAIMYRYLPYWPLFVLLLIVCSAAACVYLYMAKPIYEVSANILIKDEKKGADESKILEALNIYSSNKLVENEIEVIQSKDLLKQVIDSLHLYAAVFEDGPFVSRAAYTSSPIAIELQDPGSIQNNHDSLDSWRRIDFAYNKKDKTVTLKGATYPLDKWVSTPFGVARFSNNPNLKTEAVKPLYLSLVTPEKVLGDIAKNLSVTSAAKLSTVINLTLKDEVPERGKDILTSLIQDYNRAAINDKNVLAANTLSFVEGRIRYVMKDLDSVENQLQKFKAEKGAVDLSEQGKLYLQNVGDNDRRMTEINMELAMLQEVEKYVRSKDNQIGIVPSIAGIRDPLLSQLLQRLYESQMQYERLQKTIPGGNPTMFSLKNEIDNMRPTILENIQNQRLSLQASKDNLSANTGKFASILQNIPKKEKQLLDISRQQAIKNDAYAFLLQKREETAFAYAAAVADSRTIEQANASLGPVSPKKNLVFEVAFAIAMLLGIAIVNSREFLSNKILFRSDIESLTNLPIVAEIIKVKGKQPLIVNNTRPPAFIEQFRQLRAALGLNGKPQHKKILVTSSIAGEGKSFISNNLALSLAMTGRKVVLIDFDLRSPKTSAWHNLTEKKGVASFLENNNESLEGIIYQTEHQKLYVIPAGVSQSNPTELLINGDLQKLFNYLEDFFDFIIIDTSPVDPVTDAYVLAEYCNSTLFVVRHACTPKAMVQLLDESNKIKALKNISIVFNGIKSRGFFNKRYGYGYGYGREVIYGAKIYQANSRTSKA